MAGPLDTRELKPPPTPDGRNGSGTQSGLGGLAAWQSDFEIAGVFISKGNKMKITKGSLLEIVNPNKESGRFVARFTAIAADNGSTERGDTIAIRWTCDPPDGEIWFLVVGKPWVVKVIRQGNFRIPCKSHVRFTKIRARRGRLNEI